MRRSGSDRQLKPDRACTAANDDKGDPVSRKSGSRSVSWNALGLVSRQIVIVLSSVYLARILGPESYGVITQAAIYTAFMTLLLDQGIASSLISLPRLTRRMSAAAISANLILAAALATLTVFSAGPVSRFFHTPELRAVLCVLGVGLLLKAGVLVPRVLLVRDMNFKSQAVGDGGGALVGALVAIVGALSGMDYWSLVLQIVVSDVVVLLVLAVAARPPMPSLRLRSLRGTWGFSIRVFFSNLLSFSVQNVDNILIGRELGADSLAQYGLSYRVLTTPVQMIGQVVTRVLFPVVARGRADGVSVVPAVSRSVRGIALFSFPVMAAVSVSAHDLVPLLLGPAWTAAIPVLTILAIGGARQSVTTVNTSILMGMGLSSWLLRFSIVAATVQVTAIVVGLQFGIVGVAAGLTIAGFLLTPVVAWLSKRATGFDYGRQIGCVGPPVHGSAWACITYLGITQLLGNSALGILVSLLGGLFVYVAVLAVVHRKFMKLCRSDISAMRP
ncbi:lipopolysaccharide biosynthesis protein [Williamsia sp. 1135]|uniref:lipopolysaccharide biosynthesis protein n=1 Tax=Williamsia sp. 1135 TaxID=1889262 RepID=UPI0032048C16